MKYTLPPPQVIKKLAEQYRENILKMVSKATAWQFTLNQYSDMKGIDEESKKLVLHAVEALIRREDREAAEKVKEMQKTTGDLSFAEKISSSSSSSEAFGIEKSLNPEKEGSEYEEEAERLKNWQQEKGREQERKRYLEERFPVGEEGQGVLYKPSEILLNIKRETTNKKKPAKEASDEQLDFFKPKLR